MKQKYATTRAMSWRAAVERGRIECDNIACYTTVDLGFRYRIPALAALEIRGQIFNLLDRFSWDVSAAESFNYIAGRSFRLRLHYNF